MRNLNLERSYPTIEVKGVDKGMLEGGVQADEGEDGSPRRRCTRTS